MGAERTIREARTLDELIELEQAEALAGLQGSLAGLGEDLLAASRLRERVREHPYAWLAGAASAGLLAGPLVVRALGGLAPLAGPAWKTLVRSARGRFTR